MTRQLIARGRTADVFAWQDGQVVKLFHDWVPEHWIERELVIGRTLMHSGLPVPEIIERLTVDGQRGILYERIEGPTMLQLLTTRPWRMPALARQLAGLHTTIHARDGAGFHTVRAGLRAVIGRVDGLPAHIKSAATGMLDRLPDGNALCHFDFHPGQVILSPRGPVIIDWMSAKCGDPLADVARSMILFTFGEIPGADAFTRRLVNVVKGATGRVYLDRYLQLNPQASRVAVRAWMLPVAAARLAEDIPGEREAILAFLSRHM